MTIICTHSLKSNRILYSRSINFGRYIHNVFHLDYHFYFTDYTISRFQMKKLSNLSFNVDYVIIFSVLL